MIHSTSSSRRRAQGRGARDGGGTPERTVARLSLYRRLLQELMQEDRSHVFSHELAERVGGTAAQVRRDLMVLGGEGHPKRGYEVGALIARIGQVMDNPGGEPVVLVGLGNLGRALVPFFAAYRPNLKIVAMVDRDPGKAGLMLHGCRCHPEDELERVVRKTGARVAIVAVPAEAAQGVADRLVDAGISGVLNFAPVPLKVPDHVYIEAIDIATSLEKVAFLSRRYPLAGAGMARPATAGRGAI